MPYRIRQVDPVDLDERKAIGVKLPLSGHSVFTSTYQTVDAYKANLLNYFLTAKGDRFLNPEFGNNLRNYMFEATLTSAQLTGFKNQIQDDLAYYFPRLVLDYLSIDQYEEENMLQIYLKYHVANSGISSDLTVNFN